MNKTKPPRASKFMTGLAITGLALTTFFNLGCSREMKSPDAQNENSNRPSISATDLLSHLPSREMKGYSIQPLAEGAALPTLEAPLSAPADANAESLSTAQPDIASTDRNARTPSFIQNVRISEVGWVDGRTLERQLTSLVLYGNLGDMSRINEIVVGGFSNECNITLEAGKITTVGNLNMPPLIFASETAQHLTSGKVYLVLPDALPPGSELLTVKIRGETLRGRPRNYNFYLALSP